MRIRATWTWAIVAALPAAVAVVGCTNGGPGGAGACPTPSGGDAQCIWEGGVSFVPEEVVQKDGLVYVTGEMTWGPCNYNAGIQTRTYRIDPADGTTARMDAPEDAEPVAIDGDPIEVAPAGASHLVRLARESMESVLETELTIGELVDEATGEVASPIEVASVCEE